MEKGRGRKESFVEVKLHGNWSILESIALPKGFRLSPGLTKADVATIPQEAQSCGYVDITRENRLLQEVKMMALMMIYGVELQARRTFK